MKYSNIPLAQTVVQFCKAKNIQHIVISPGSRNAPLTIGFTEDPFFKTYSIVDERCAAFFALGIAQQLRKPTAVVCTSGSALLNYYPAVSEAFYSDIPLLLISADRPDYAIDIGDGQTIRQKNVFENHILYSANLKLDHRNKGVKVQGDGKNKPKIMKELDPARIQNDIQKYNEKEINKAIDLAFHEKGPAHINVPFEEPLYEITDIPCVSITTEEAGKKDDALNVEELKPYADIWNASGRKMILVGVDYPDSIEKDIIEKLANDPSVIVFTETTSNLHHENFFPGIDKIIAPIEIDENREQLFGELQPEILVTFGGLVVSKKIKAFLRKYQPKHHWHIDNKKAYNTFYCLENHFKTNANSFFKSFFQLIAPHDSTYQSYWLEARNNRRKQHAAYLDQIPFSDLKVFESLLESIPDNWQLQLSNSSTIRYSQLFELNPSLKVYCNRGTSGIDGSTTTAIGASIIEEEPTLLITGDLSFLYDSNALWNNHIKKNFRIIVINNGGGGIFRILPGHKDTDNFDTYFETKHNLTAQHLCSMYGLEYVKASDQEEVTLRLEDFYMEGEKPKLLEIFTPSKLNDDILVKYFKFLNAE